MAVQEDSIAFSAIHWLAAGLAVAAGAETALEQRRSENGTTSVLRWAPLLAAPLAAAAHAARAVAPGRTTRVLAQIANGLAVGVGAAGLASSIYGMSSDSANSDDDDWLAQLPSLAPLAFAGVGVLGMLIDDEENEVAEARAALEQRARWVERLVPRRKAKLDRIVVHV